MGDSDVQTATVAAFNHYYAVLLRDVKAHGVGRGAIKKHYHRFDHADAGHLAKWAEWTPALVARLTEDPDAALDDDALAEDTQLFEGIYLEQVLAAGVPRGPLIQALIALAVAARLHEVGASTDDVAAARRHLQAPTEDAEIDDERVRALVRAAAASAEKHRPPPRQELPPEVAEHLRKLEDTKIGRMAREISESIGPASINDPASLAAVIGKVGGAMQAKMRAGEINHGELLSEAMGMIGTLPSLFQAATGGTPTPDASGGIPGMPADVAGMADMLKGVLGCFGNLAQQQQQQQQNTHGDRNSSARSRLASKLAARRGQAP